MNNHTFDVVTVGELLVDMISTDKGASLEESRGFVKACGGAVANVAAGCARLGLKTAFIGKVGNDPFGRFLDNSLRAFGVDTRGLRFSREHETPLVFVSLDTDSKPSFFFHGRPSADLMLEAAEVDEGLVRSAKVLHFGTVSLSMEPARSATRHAVDVAKKAGAMISYDPNIRLHMWKDPNAALDWAARMIPQADVLKVSDDEADLLIKIRDPIRAASEFLKRGPKLVLVTLGARGAYFSCAAGSGHVGAPKVNAIDTTGAGDAFVAGLLRGLNDLGERPFDNAGGVREAVRKACAAAALTTEALGAVSALPDLATLNAAMAGRFSGME